MVKDILSGDFPLMSSHPKFLTNVNGTLYFTADDETNGRELWKSNGTAAGTVMVKDISIISGSVPSALTNVNGTLYFTAYDRTNGRELWTSDGTAAGTLMVADFYPGDGGGRPERITVVNNRVFVTAYGPDTGNELYVQDLTRGTPSNDAFVLKYSGTGSDQKVTVTLSTNGGPVETLGIFPTTFSLPITGLGGNDSLRIEGTIGNDKFVGNQSSISVNGATVLLSGIESRTLAGGAGNDSYQFDADTSLGVFILDEAGGGVDTIDLAATAAAVTVNLGTSTPQVINANLSLNLRSGSTFENATGGAGDDILIGNARTNRLIGNGGNNVLIGNGGNDSLTGGSGRDILVGGDALDTLNGGSGDDILIAGRTSSDANLAKLIDMRTEWTSANSYATRIKNLRAGVGASVASLKAKVNVLNDAGEDDSLTGNTGNDWYFRALDDIISDLVTGELIDVL